MLGEASDDGIDEPSRPPPGLLDRCWVHPTELGALTEGCGRPARTVFAAVGITLLAGIVLALLTVALLVALAIRAELHTMGPDVTGWLERAPAAVAAFLA